MRRTWLVAHFGRMQCPRIVQPYRPSETSSTPTGPFLDLCQLRYCDRAADSKFSTNARHHRLDLALDELRLKAQHAISGTPQYRITRSIRPRALHVIRPIDLDLDHEPPSWRKKVSDESAEQRH